jgi:sulfhydrogenase subunit beta (sulfur reductase)
MTEKYQIEKENWKALLRGWRERYTLLAPQKERRGLGYQKVTSDNDDSVVYGFARAAQPLKTFFLPPLQEVTGKTTSPSNAFLFLGVKACDLQALPILDRAFGGDFPDSRYQKTRGESLIVSSDCTEPWETCFCELVGGHPFPDRQFDLNLSEIGEGFLIEVGSDRGKELLKSQMQFLKKADKKAEQELDKKRKETIRKVKQINGKFKISKSQRELVAPQRDSEVWSKHAKTCVECGACNHACPTCHCYFLDDVTRQAFVKLRGWDACMYSGYAVTAGGHSPRARLHQRFRNRYFCKFKYLDDNYGQIGCTGCGRCIEGCQGLIDMRAAIKDLE